MSTFTPDENKTLLGLSSEEERFDSSTNSPARFAHNLSPPILNSSMAKSKNAPTQATEFTTKRVLNAIGGRDSPVLVERGKGFKDPMKGQDSSSGMEDDAMEMMEMQERKKKKKGKKGGGGGGGKKWRDMTPEERRIKEESEDAKSFFSNERTFLGWIGLTFSLGAIGTAIITFFGTEGVSLGTGLFLWAIALMFMLYATIQFRRRGHAIRTKTQGPFDDQRGPISLVVMVVVGVAIYLIFFVVIRPEANINFGNNTRSTKN